MDQFGSIWFNASLLPCDALQVMECGLCKLSYWESQLYSVLRCLGVKDCGVISSMLLGTQNVSAAEKVPAETDWSCHVQGKMQEAAALSDLLFFGISQSLEIEEYPLSRVSFV